MGDKLPKIFLNLDFYTKGRNLKWIKSNGGEAVAILQNVWIASSQEKNCRIKKDDAYALSFNLLFQDSKVIQVLESAVEAGLLESDGEFYYNSQIVSHAKNFQKKHNNYVKAHEKRKRIHDESIVDLPTIQNESIVDSIVPIPVPNTVKDLDLKNKSKTQTLTVPQWVLNDPRASNAVIEWINYRKDKKAKLLQSTLDAQLKRFNTPEILSDAIGNSIEKGWTGLFEPDKPQSAGGIPKSIVETRAKYEALDNQ